MRRSSVALDRKQSRGRISGSSTRKVDGRGDQVGGEDGFDAHAELDEEQQVEPQVEQDIAQLDGGEFFRLPLQAQVGEGDQGQGIEEQDEDDVIDQLGIAGRDLHQADEGMAQQKQRRGQQQGRQDDGKIGGGESLLFFLRRGQRAVFHEGGVHAVDVDDIQERQVGVDVGVDPHVAARDEMGVEGDEQKAEKTADDGARCRRSPCPWSVP